jgi:hypothetical protein
VIRRNRCSRYFTLYVVVNVLPGSSPATASVCPPPHSPSQNRPFIS